MNAGSLLLLCALVAWAAPAWAYRPFVVGPDRALYVATRNRDGHGSPIREDDRILRVIP